MTKVKIKNKLNHRLLIKGKLLDPNEECELELDNHVDYCIKKGIVEEVKNESEKTSTEPKQEETQVENIETEETPTESPVIENNEKISQAEEPPVETEEEEVKRSAKRGQRRKGN